MRLNSVITLRSFVISLTVSAACLAQAQITYNFKTIDVPGTASTSVYGNNGTGHIVGEYFATESVGGGFLLSQGVFKNIAFPGAIRTSPEGINIKGQVVGIYIDKSGASHGFQLKGTTYTSIDFPKSTLTDAYSINQSGVIVGTYYDGARYHGYMLQGTQFTTIDFQNPVGQAPLGSIAVNINDQGQVVGEYSLTDPTVNNGQQGYLQTGSVYSTIDYPLAQQTWCEGINNSGQVVGNYIDSTGSHGFTFIGGTYATMDFPGATISAPLGINDSGQIVGLYVIGSAISSPSDGFLATPIPGTSSTPASSPRSLGRRVRK